MCSSDLIGMLIYTRMERINGVEQALIEANVAHGYAVLKQAAEAVQKLPAFLQQRRKIAKRYDLAFSRIPEITPLAVHADVLHAYHLYVVKVILTSSPSTVLPFSAHCAKRGLA